MRHCCIYFIWPRKIILTKIKVYNRFFNNFNKVIFTSQDLKFNISIYNFVCKRQSIKTVKLYYF